MDKTGKMYIPKAARSKMDVDSKYIVLTLPDGDIVLHRMREAKDTLKDFQSFATIKKPILGVKRDILKEALAEAVNRCTQKLTSF